MTDPVITPHPIDPEPLAVIPTRPASGGPIASAWGGDIHDRAYTPKVNIGSGSATALAVGARIPFAHNAGSAGTWANNGFTIASGNDGLFIVTAEVQANAGTANTDVRAMLRTGAAALSGCHFNINATQPMRANMLYIGTLAAGQEVFVTLEGTAWTVQLIRIALMRVGNAYG